MKKIMLTALIAVISSTAHANSGDRVNDNGLIYEENNDGVMVLVPDESYKERMRVDIPGSINFMPVMIGDYAFRDCTKLREIVINEGVEIIGTEAFAGIVDTYDGEDEVSITLPSTIREIGYAAFSCYAFGGSVDESIVGSVPFNCTLNISDLQAWCGIQFDSNGSNPGGKVFLNGERISDLTIYDSQINNNCFARWELESINLPYAVEIGDGAFYCCGLKSIDIPYVRTIGNMAFQNNCLTEIELPQIEQLGRQSFANNESLQTVAFPTTLRLYGEGVFQDCENLSAINVAEGNPYLLSRDGVLYSRNEYISGHSGSYTALTQVPCATTEFTFAEDLPAPLGAISTDAFNGCRHIEKIEIPSGVIKIWDNAFQNSFASYIRIPCSVESIGFWVFGQHFDTLIFENGGGFADDSSGSMFSPYIAGNASFRVCYLGRDFVYGPNSLPLFPYEVNSISYKNGPLEELFIANHTFQPGNVALNSPQSGSYSAKNIYLHSDIQPQLTQDFYSGVYNTARLFVPEDELDYYLSDEKWSKFAQIYPWTPYEANSVEPVSFQTDGFTYNIISRKHHTCAISFMNTSVPDAPSLTIPSTVYDPNHVGEDMEVIGIATNKASGNYGYSFYQDYAIKSAAAELNIPATVKYIDDKAFCGLRQLTDVRCDATVPPVCFNDPFYNTTYRSARLIVPDGCSEDYRNAPVWKNFTDIIDESQSSLYGVTDGHADEAIISVEDGEIIIGGLSETPSVNIYDISGHLIRATQSNRITNLGHGTYIVNVAGHNTKKVSL